MSVSNSPSSSNRDILSRLDAGGFTWFQGKVLLTASMGFFTDAYDLFIIGVALRLIEEEWHLSTLDRSLVTSTALIASAIGALIFGRVADVLGRKRIYGVEVLVLAAGAVASACAPSIGWLIFFRVILGLGIGGDYPVSSTIMSEYAGKSSRGMLISLVFAAQGLGLIVGPAVVLGLLATGMSHSLTWRIMLALGAVPALSVYFMRRHIKETPRFALASGHAEEASAAADSALGREEKPGGTEGAEPWRKPAAHELRQLVRGRLLARLVGAAGAWFLLDFAFYANTVASAWITALVDPGRDLWTDTCILLAIFAATLPGYFLAALFMDRLGRKPIQVGGFVLMALMFALMGLIPDITQRFWLFVFLFAGSFFFTQFGPNTTTFIYPAEIFPVHLRTTGHGIAASAGKLGGFAGVFAFPFLLHHLGLAGTELVVAGVCVLGALLTLALLPETRGRSLEELSEEAAPEKR